MSNNSQLSDNDSDTCSNNFPYSDFYLQHLNVVEKVFISAGGILTLVILGIFLYELRWIWETRHYNNVLYIIIWLLGLYPIASFCSMIATLAPRSVLFCEFVAAAYLGICLYKFVGLIVTYYGGLEQMVIKKTGCTIALRSPPLACCCCCCPSVEPSKENLVRMQYLVLQCALVKPPLMFIATILWTENLYSKSFSLKNPGTYVSLVNGVSTLIAMYGLILLFRSSREDLKSVHLLPKFFCLQIALICLNLQTVIFSTLASYNLPHCVNTLSSRVRSNVIHHLLLIIEMFILSLVAKHYYLKRGTLDYDDNMGKPLDAANGKNGEPLPNYAAINPAISIA